MTTQQIKDSHTPATVSVATAFTEATQREVVQALLTDVQNLRNTVDSLMTSLAASAAEATIDLGIPAAKAVGVNEVHAGLAATAANAFPGPFTAPDVPRNLRVKFATGWDGGDVTVWGTDQFGRTVSETFTGASNVTRTGAKIFNTVVAASKGTVGEASAEVCIGLGDKLGIPKMIVQTTLAVLEADSTPESGTWDATYSAVTPTTTPGTAAFVVTAHVNPCGVTAAPATVSTGA